MNCTLASLLRFLSFMSMSALNYFGYGFGAATNDKNTDDDDITSKTEVFFEKASIVLFDLPDFCIVSAYVLLLVVWAESILQSRRHWLSSHTFKRLWMLSYVIFNTLLYVVQISLYSLLFAPNVNQYLLAQLIYYTLCTLSFGLPLVWIVFYFYLSMLFAGFPHFSEDARQRLSSLSQLGTCWTLGRLMWAMCVLRVVMHSSLTTPGPSSSTAYYTFILVGVFAITEVVPILMGYYNSALGHERPLELLSEEGPHAPLTSKILDQSRLIDRIFPVPRSESVTASSQDSPYGVQSKQRAGSETSDEFYDPLESDEKHLVARRTQGQHSRNQSHSDASLDNGDEAFKLCRAYESNDSLSNEDYRLGAAKSAKSAKGSSKSWWWG